MPKKVYSSGFYFRLFRRNFSRLYLPYLLVVIAVVIAYLNYTPNTWLTGWDNLHPEFNFSLNLNNTIFSVWQERGPGFLAGMSPAADLPRQIFLTLIGITQLIPLSFFRYLWTFFCLIVGPIGTYLLLNHYFLKPRFDPKTKRIAAFLGGLFYLLNLATVQYFFVPFESFVTFYAILPYFLLATTLYLEKPTPRRLLLLAIIFIASTPAFFVQTFFVVTCLCLIPIITTHIRRHLKAVFIYCILLFITQSFWLLPQIFFVLTNASNVSLAHANLMSSPETLYRNLEFTNFLDVALLKGYWLNILDPVVDNRFDYLFLVWRNHLNTPTIQIIGILSFVLIFIGAFYSLKKKLPLSKPFLAILLICISSLLGGVLILGNEIPILGELFRSPFTKFSIPLALSYSVFFSVGCIFLLDLFQSLHSQLTHYLTLFTVTAALVVFATPAFTGNMISPLMRQKIPTTYLQLFDYFNKLDPATRIANFPQYQIWGWNYYRWGYRGAGFLWYGIKQPIMDRGFDVWSNNSEKYYEEISQSIYQENREQFNQVLDKYAINYLIVDKNIFAPGSSADIGFQKVEKLIKSSNNLSLVNNIDDQIYIYKTEKEKTTKNFLSLSQCEMCNLQSKMFSDLPLRPIPTGSSLSLDDTTVTLRSKISLDSNFSHNYTITIPSITQEENYLPSTVFYRKTPQGIQLKITPILPSILVDNNKLSQDVPSTTLDFPLSTTQNGFVLEIDGNFYELQIPDEVNTQTIPYSLTTIHLPTRRPIKTNLYANTPSYRSNITNSLTQSKAVQCYTNKPNRKIETINDRNSVTIYGTDVVACLPVALPYLPDPSQLISLSFKYSSTTLTPADANITNNTFGDSSPSISLPAHKNPTFTRIFSHPLGSIHQANFLLEANETKTTQEITYADPLVAYHDSLGSSEFFLPKIPLVKYSLEFQPKNIQVDLPLIDSPLTIAANSQSNNLNPNPKNCDNFNTGTFDKTLQENFSDPLLNEITQTGDKKIDSSGFLYKAINANSCDQVDLKTLPHDTNYSLIFDTQHISGLPITTCLENHSTRRCDVFERLDKDADKQMIIQPISNPNESLGYTLHFFNQSFGNRPTENLVRSITTTPFPLNFLQNISINSSTNAEGDKCAMCNLQSQILKDSSHPAEFLYTAHIDTDKDSTLNLYQSYSPYWIALKVDENFFNQPLYKMILEIPLQYFKTKNLKFEILDSVESGWHNSFTIPAGNNHYIIFYAPQYLQFIGLLLLPLSLFVYFLFYLFRKKLS